MSSSRSIAAARNRRAGDPAPTSRQQSNFSQQQQQQQQNKKIATSQNSTPNVPVTSNNAKLTISDAIGLITLRLGRVEQFIQTAEHEGGLNMRTSIPDNAHLVDKSVINSIVNRLDSLEKKERESANNQQNSKLETEIRDIKDLLMSQIVKYEKLSLETDKRFAEVNDAFIVLENEQNQTNCCDAQNETEEIANTSENVFTNLKNVIEQELADSGNL